MRLQDVIVRSGSQKADVASLEYIAGMLEELKTMAPETAGPMLPYLVDMARLEAIEAVGRIAGNRRPAVPRKVSGLADPRC